MKKRILFAIALVMMLSMLVVPVKAEAATVALNASRLNMSVGQTAPLRLNGVNYTPTWTTSDSSVVTVDKDGNVKAVGAGSATVTASVGKYKFKCKVVSANFDGLTDEEKKVVYYCTRLVGGKYRYGGSNLLRGVDCSGFSMGIYALLGYKLPHNAYQQQFKVRPVYTVAQLRPGDLIFYGSSWKSCNHVAVYIGDGLVIHASTSTTGIVVSKYDYRKICYAGRVLKTQAPASQTTTETNNNNSDNNDDERPAATHESAEAKNYR